MRQAGGSGISLFGQSEEPAGPGDLGTDAAQKTVGRARQGPRNVEKNVSSGLGDVHVGGVRRQMEELHPLDGRQGTLEMSQTPAATAAWG